MIVRNLSFLLVDELKEATLTIKDNKSLSLVHIPHRGYALYIIDGDERKDTFLIKSDYSPSELDHDENVKEKNDFVDLVQLFLNKIYADYDIPDFEKEHPEFVLLKLIDSFEKDNVNVIDRSSETYNLITLGFIRFENDLLLMDNR